MRVRLQQNLWNGDSPVDISLPEDWNVQIVRMPCDDQPVLSYDPGEGKNRESVGDRAS